MTALQWILKEAKSLKKQYPKRFTKWTDYVAQASAIYASKHKGKSPVGKKKAVKKKAAKKTTRKKVSGVKDSAKVRKELAKKGLKMPHGYATTKRKRIGSVKKKKVSEQSILNKIHKVKDQVNSLDELQHKHMSSIGGVGKTQTGAMVRVYAKHKLRSSGFNVPSEISTTDLNKLYKHITGKNVPTITKVRKLLKKFNNNTTEVYKHI